MDYHSKKKWKEEKILFAFSVLVCWRLWCRFVSGVLSDHKRSLVFFLFFSRYSCAMRRALLSGCIRNLTKGRVSNSARWVSSIEDDEDDVLVAQLIQQSDIQFTNTNSRGKQALSSAETASNFTSEKRLAHTTAIESPRSDLATATPPSANSLKEPVPNSILATSPSPPPSSSEATSLRSIARAFVHVRNNASGVLEWQCLLCSIYNHVRRLSCRGCGGSSRSSQRDAQPTPSRFVPTMPAAWVCTVPTCLKLNIADSRSGVQRERYLCSSCKSPFQGVHDWLCSSCSAPNPRGLNQCHQCFSSRTVDWACPSCKCKQNCIFSTVCVSCKYERHPSADAAPLTRCPSCDSAALPHWELCSVCLAPLEHMLSLIGAPLQKTTPATPKRLLAPSNRSRESPSVLERSDAIAPGSQSHTHRATDGAATTSVASIPPSSSVVPSVSPGAARGEDWVGGSQPLILSLHPPMPTAARILKPYSANDQTTSWKCGKCGLWHRFNTPFCDSCLEPRLKSVSSPAASSSATEKAAPITPALAAGKPPGWKCQSCHAVNTHFTRICIQCHTTRQMPEGYWQCTTCNSVNRNSRYLCLGCFKQHAPPPQVVFTGVDIKHASSSGGCTWTCFCCSFDANRSHSTQCSSCGKDRHVWNCPCNRTNQLSHKQCASCNAPRSIAANTFAWICHECGFEGNNLLDSSSCKKCGGTTSKVVPPRWIWVCNLCQEPNSDRSEVLPPTLECSKCETSTNSSDVKSSLRDWTCQVCNTDNRVQLDLCTTCKGRRRMQWRFSLDCPACQKPSVPSEEETCPHCGESLTVALSALWGRIVLDARTMEAFGISNPAAENQATIEVAENDKEPEDDEEDDSGGDRDSVDGGAIDAMDSAPMQSNLSPPPHNSWESASKSSTNVGINHAVGWVCSLCGNNNVGCVECVKCSMPKGI